MNTLAERFIRVKTRVGGNREKTEFEFTFGAPKETLFHVTPPAAHIRRILAETDLAIKLSAEKNGAADACVDSALKILEKGLDADGVLTKACADEAEKALMPLTEDAKSYTVLCAAHAHIDMNWMWGWQETVAATLATFRTMLQLMKEYPSFKFSQSQASVYHVVEEYDPDMMDEIKQRIREGRWEITATAWVETDKNMPDTESLLRHVRYTRDYLRDSWGVDPDSLKIDFSPDTFGHSVHLPELDGYANVDYYYHCRGITTDEVLYRWKAPSGRELLMYREPFWYNSGITSDIGTCVTDISKHSGGLKTSLIVYGVGDHGGGPTRRDIECIQEMQAWPVFPEIRFGTFIEYFRAAESARANCQLVEHALNPLFTGCYTTQSRVKRGNRMSEAALLDAETASMAANVLLGAKYPAGRFVRAWRNVLFTHFHDILTGSCVQESREHAMGLYQESLAFAQTEREKATRAISDAVDTSAIVTDDAEFTQAEGAGVGYGLDALSGTPAWQRGRGKTRIFHVFNPMPFARAELTEITVWDWMYDMKRIDCTDENGNALPFQLLDHDQQRYWDHRFFRVLVQTRTPSVGVSTVVLREKQAQDYPTLRLLDDRVESARGEITMENEYLRATFSGDGELVSLFDKEAGAERIKTGERAALKLVMTEHRSSNAWNIGRYLEEQPMREAINVRHRGGALRQSVEVEQRVLGSKVKTKAYLDKGSRALAYEFEIDWNEAARGEDPVPVLTFAAKLAEAPECVRMDVPAGKEDRPSQQIDMAGLTHATAVYGDRALSMTSDCKYGYRCFENTLRVTLVNTADSPDPYPERGIQHVKMWLTACASDETTLKTQSTLKTHRSNVVTATKHGGSIPGTASLLTVDGGTAVVSSIGMRDGDVVIRLYEAMGKTARVTVKPQFAFGKATLCDGDYRDVEAVPVIDGLASFTVKPYSLTCLKIMK